jgi:uncharacterized protein YkwD
MRLTIFLFLSTFCTFTVSAQTTVDRVEMLSAVNQLRAKGCRCGGKWMPPAPPLRWNDLLKNAAQAHADDMSQRKYFKHKDLEGRSFSFRIERAGYKNWSSVGENIAMGYYDITEVMQGWKTSPGHCKSMMSPSYKDVGVSRQGTIWVMDLAQE